MVRVGVLMRILILIGGRSSHNFVMGTTTPTPTPPGGCIIAILAMLRYTIDYKTKSVLIIIIIIFLLLQGNT